jgi:hypothetical protein
MIPLKSFLEQRGFAPVTIAPPPIINSDPFVPVVEIDEEYEEWKHEMGLDVPMSEQQVIDCYTYELAVL